MRPRLAKQLEQYSEVAQTTLDSHVKHTSLEYLSGCLSSFNILSGAYSRGYLSSALTVVHDVELVLNQAPEPLSEAAVIVDLKVCMLY